MGIVLEIDTVPVIKESFTTFWFEKIASFVIALLYTKSMVFTPVKNAVFFPEMVTANVCPAEDLFGLMVTLCANSPMLIAMNNMLIVILVFINIFI